MTSETLSVLIADDNETFRERLARAFSERGWTVYTAGDAESAIKEVSGHNPEYVILDLKMPGATGLNVLKEILNIDPETHVLILTGYGSIPTAIEAIKSGAKNYLTKPVDAEDILKTLLHGTKGQAEQTLSTPSLARTEWEHIQRVLEDCDGNVSEAARRLKIHRRSLQRKLQKKPPKT